MRSLIIAALLLGVLCPLRATGESLERKIKKIFQPARTPTPARKLRKRIATKPTPTPSPTPWPKQRKASPTPTPTATPKSKSKRKRTSPSPTPAPSGKSPPPTLPGTLRQPTPVPVTNVTPNVTLSPDEIIEYDTYPPKVRQIIDTGLALTKQNLGYTYGSADPANGGMDCSGFI
jgi:hypothetical protein